jgi:hypothetical protein
MASHTHNGLTYEPLGIELHEVSRAKHDNKLYSETSRAPSYTSGLTRYSRVDDDDERFLIPHRGSSTPEYRSDKASKESEVSSQSLRKRRYRFKSWKVGVTTAAVMTTAVLLVNFLLTVWASVKFGLDGGIGTVYEGACSTVSAWSFWLHILINGLSSMLLSASNYTMQCVTAPTRRECDRAHARGDWLDIGVPSVRNLFRIGRRRRLMWALLALSSIPIHLLYNSAVFKTLDDNSYTAVLAGPSFLETNYTLASTGMYPSDDEHITKHHESYLRAPTSFKNISSTTCIDTYATYYLSGHGDLILIASDKDMEDGPQVFHRYEYRGGNHLSAPFIWQVRGVPSIHLR